MRLGGQCCALAINAELGIDTLQDLLAKVTRRKKGERISELPGDCGPS
jgi:hypothetical protein